MVLCSTVDSPFFFLQVDLAKISHQSYHVAWFSKNIPSIISLGFTSRSLPSVFEVPLWQGLLLASSLVGTDLLMEVTKGATFKANDLLERSYQLWAQATFLFWWIGYLFYGSIMMWLTLHNDVVYLPKQRMIEYWPKGFVVDWGQSFQWNVPLSLRRVRPGRLKTIWSTTPQAQNMHGRMIHESDPGHQGWQIYHLGHGWSSRYRCMVGGWINEGKSSCL